MAKNPDHKCCQCCDECARICGKRIIALEFTVPPFEVATPGYQSGGCADVAGVYKVPVLYNDEECYAYHEPIELHGPDWAALLGVSGINITMILGTVHLTMKSACEAGYPELQPFNFGVAAYVDGQTWWFAMNHTVTFRSPGGMTCEDFFNGVDCELDINSGEFHVCGLPGDTTINVRPTWV